MSEKDIDKLFGDKLGDFEMKPSDDLWNKIAGDIGNTYTPDASSINEGGASSSSSGSASTSSASTGSASGVAIKGGAALGGKILTLKTVIISAVSAVGITSAVILSKDNDQSKEDSFNKVEYVKEKSDLIKEVESESLNSNNKADQSIETNTETKNSIELDNIVQEEKENVTVLNEETDFTLDSKYKLKGTQGNQNSLPNDTQEEIESNLQSEESTIPRQDDEASTKENNTVKLSRLDSKENDQSSNSDVDRGVEDARETKKVQNNNVDSQSYPNNKSSKEEAKQFENEQEQLEDPDIENPTESDDMNNSGKELDNQSLKGQGDKEFSDTLDKDESSDDINNKTQLEVEKIDFIFSPDTGTFVSDSAMIADVSDKSKGAIFPLIKPSFKPIGLYASLGAGVEQTSFVHGDRSFNDKMGTISFKGNIGYEFKNGLYLGTGLYLLGSELVSKDPIEFNIYANEENYAITESYLSNGLVETVISAEWIDENFDLFDEGTYFHYEEDGFNEEETGEEFDEDDLIDWWDYFFDADDEYDYGLVDTDSLNEYNSRLVYSFVDEIDYVDRVSRTVFPLNLGYNHNRGRWTYFAQMNAELHFVSLWTRDIYFKGDLIETIEMEDAASRTFIGLNAGVGYFFNSGFQLRASYGVNSGVNTYEHGEVEDIRLNTSSLNLSLRWKI